MTGKGVVRSVKNHLKGFSDAQRKVREATSNDPWGPSGTLMNEIAQLTYNQHDFIEIMDMIDKRLNDKGKNWRHVFKALLLLDYCLHVGSENVVLYAKENVYVVKTLKEFQHVDDNGRDVGANVRQKAKDISSLLVDDARLKEERRSRQQMRERMAGVNDYLNDAMGLRQYSPEDIAQYSGPRDNEDQDLQRAIAESKRLAEDEARKRREKADEDDLQKAIRLSEQEARDRERKQKEKLERDNLDKLFGNGNEQPVAAQPTGFNPFGQQFSDPIGANNNGMMYQNTGMTSNPYQQTQSQSNPYQQFGGGGGGFGNSLQAQMTGMPPQMTGQTAPFQTSSATGFLQPQMTGFPAQQTGFQQPQMTGFQPQSPYSLNSLAAGGGVSSMSTGFASQPQPVQPQVTAASNNPFGPKPAQQQQLPQQQQQQTPMQPQATGAFGGAFSASPTVQSASLSQPSPSFGFATANTPTAGQSRSFTFPSASPAMPTATGSPANDRYAKLNALLANKEDGLDTFGNTGDMRIPHHYNQ
ncbi:hypothetical protein BCR43DRAFT_488186 [Syncephalastrum racemosum]|uniref:ENTH domain-containing protein n=1 Tax=Syncephalastrum racemosum TaxID=13706 RepID=A0A1X2HIA8_SYNRA|nr:hypothetical protein BCR43DRAFT_488186 [Syncephalastrum racemosum]